MGKVSVIVPTHKGRDISKLLRSIEASTYKDMELIIVCEGLERSAQRNIGIDRATGKYLLILDSDMGVHPELIKECVKCMIWHDAVYIPEIIIAKGWFARIRNWERSFYNGTAIDAVRFVRAEGCPRFDEAMSGPEDSDWDRRVKGYKTISNHPLYHYDQIDILTYYKKKSYYTKSMKYFIEKHPNDKVLDLKYRCWTVFTEDDKWIKLIMHPFLTLSLLLILFLRGLIYLPHRR